MLIHGSDDSGCERDFGMIQKGLGEAYSTKGQTGAENKLGLVAPDQFKAPATEVKDAQASANVPQSRIGEDAAGDAHSLFIACEQAWPNSGLLLNGGEKVTAIASPAHGTRRDDHRSFEGPTGSATGDEAFDSLHACGKSLRGKVRVFRREAGADAYGKGGFVKGFECFAISGGSGDQGFDRVAADVDDGHPAVHRV
jgi:hypothetical protein